MLDRFGVAPPPGPGSLPPDYDPNWADVLTQSVKSYSRDTPGSVWPRLPGTNIPQYYPRHSGVPLMTPLRTQADLEEDYGGDETVHPYLRLSRLYGLPVEE